MAAGGVITTGSFAEELWPGIKKIYGRTYDEWTVVHSQIFEYEKSRRAYEEILGNSGLGLAPVKPEGSGVVFSTMKQGFKQRSTHVAYALGFIITEEAYEDNLYDMPMKAGSKGLAFSMRQTKEVVGANIFNRAFSGSFLFSDGASLISSAHPNVSGGTWSNLATADLDEDSLEAAVTAISVLKNDAGLTIGLKPRCLIIPPALEFEASRVLNSIGQNDTANNAQNALRYLGSIPKVIVNPYLTDTDAWFIQTNAPTGMIYFDRKADDFKRENEFNTSNAKFKASGRYSFTVADARAIYGSAGV